MVIERLDFEGNYVTLVSCLTFKPKTGMGLPKTGINFHYDEFPVRVPVRGGQQLIRE